MELPCPAQWPRAEGSLNTAKCAQTPPSRPFTHSVQLTCPAQWPRAECSLSTMKCAQTQVLRGRQLLSGFRVTEATLATLINNPQPLWLITTRVWFSLVYQSLLVFPPGQWVAVLTPVSQGLRVLPASGVASKRPRLLPESRWRWDRELLKVLAYRWHTSPPCTFCIDYWPHGHTCKSKELENAVLDWAAIFPLNSILWKGGTIFVWSKHSILLIFNLFTLL